MVTLTNWRLFASLLLILVCEHLVIDQSLAWLNKFSYSKQRTIVDDYDDINSLLADRTGYGTNISGYFDEVQSWIGPNGRNNSSEKNSANQLSESQKKNLASIRPEAIGQFLAMAPIYRDKTCFKNDYKIVQANEQATGMRIMIPISQFKASGRPIDMVARAVAKRHVEQCRHVYPKVFKVQLAKLGPKYRKNLARLMSGLAEVGEGKCRLIKPLDRKLDKAELFRKHAKHVSILGELESRAILFYIRESATKANDTDEMFLHVLSDRKRRNMRHVHGPKVVKLLERYVIDKCNTLDKNMGQVMRAVIYDQNFYEQDGGQYKAVNEDYSNFISYLEYSKLCTQISRHSARVAINLVSTIRHLEDAENAKGSEHSFGLDM